MTEGGGGGRKVVPAFCFFRCFFFLRPFRREFCVLLCRFEIPLTVTPSKRSWRRRKRAKRGGNARELRNETIEPIDLGPSIDFRFLLGRQRASRQPLTSLRAYLCKEESSHVNQRSTRKNWKRRSFCVRRGRRVESFKALVFSFCSAFFSRSPSSLFSFLLRRKETHREQTLLNSPLASLPLLCPLSAPLARVESTLLSGRPRALG